MVDKLRFYVVPGEDDPGHPPPDPPPPPPDDEGLGNG